MEAPSRLRRAKCHFRPGYRFSAGVIAILSGAAAIRFRKGAERSDWKVFLVSILILSSSAVYLAIVNHQTNNIFGGVLAFYLVTLVDGQA